MNKLKNLFLKRMFDIIVASILLLLFTPILLIISCLIYFKLGLPILFTQLRPGKDSNPFTLYKFRTMLNVYDNSRNLIDDNKRITKFGIFLRSTSLDELPELINVLKGNMSLVGPRPLLMEYLDKYDKEQDRRHEVRPGITG